MPSSGILRSLVLIRAEVPEELSAYIVRVTRIGELETTLVVTSNRRTLRRNIFHPIDGGAKFLRNVGSHKSHTV
jgi:hypothetical protein